MAEKSSFGIDAKFLEGVDFDLARRRVINDFRSDFILAPHLSCIFIDAFDDLKAALVAELKAGSFAPQLPISISVPKKLRLPTYGSKRLAPNFVRFGSILYPKDRLLHQMLGDIAAPTIEGKLDRTVCFSHQLADPGDQDRMFRPNRQCWAQMQQALAAHVKAGTSKAVLKADIASCFQNINQHTLLNSLQACGYPKELIKPLGSMLSQASVTKSSRGIVQGIYPSDLFGNFYLYPIDRFFADHAIRSIRYVDDLYAFFDSHEQAEQVTLALYDVLASLDLQLNEAKSHFTTPISLFTTDPDLDALFSLAVSEVEEQFAANDYEEIDTDYGFQTIWISEDDAPHPNSDEIVLEATAKLFDQVAQYPGSVEEIERFCLPLFSIFRSTYALDHVLSKVETTPSMAQIYFNYLAALGDDEKVPPKIFQLVEQRRLLFDWEYMWAIGALLRLAKVPDSTVGSLLKFVGENRHEAVKSLALIAAAKHGDHHRQLVVSNFAKTLVSPYVQSAIVFSARYMTAALRKNVLDVVAHQGELTELVAESVKKH